MAFRLWLQNIKRMQDSDDLEVEMSVDKGRQTYHIRIEDTIIILPRELESLVTQRSVKGRKDFTDLVSKFLKGQNIQFPVELTYMVELQVVILDMQRFSGLRELEVQLSVNNERQTHRLKFRDDPIGAVTMPGKLEDIVYQRCDRGGVFVALAFRFYEGNSDDTEFPENLAYLKEAKFPIDISFLSDDEYGNTERYENAGRGRVEGSS
jgi:hypothetical protein